MTTWSEGPPASEDRVVVPEVEGTAHITGRNQLWIDPNDPFKDGFILR